MSTMPPSPANARSFMVLGLLTGFLAILDLALVAVAGVAWNAQRLGYVAGRDIATITLLGVSAAAGAIILILVSTANVSAARTRGHGRRLAVAGSGLAWLRLVAVFVATAVLAVTLGLSAVAGLTKSFAVALTVVDALAAVFVARVTLRRLRTPHG